MILYIIYLAELRRVVRFDGSWTLKLNQQFLPEWPVHGYMKGYKR